MSATDDPRVMEVADVRVMPEVHVLTAGVDALYMSGRCLLDHNIWKALETLRNEVAADGERREFHLGEACFYVAGTGLRRYPIRLDHVNGVVGVSESAKLPELWVQPRAQFLHAVGPVAAVQWFRSNLNAAFGSVELSASRVDLFADWQGWCPVAEDRSRILTRAQQERANHKGERFTGFEFGRRSSGLCARMYDKTEQIRGKPDGRYWFEIWADRYRSDVPVWRWEIEFGRSTLRQFRLDTPEEVLAGVADLWKCAMSEWLTFRDPTGDATRARWPLSSEWVALQNVDLGVSPVGLERMRAAKNVGSLERSEQALVRALVGFGALHGRSVLGDIILDVPSAVRSYELRTGRSFVEELVRKRRERAF